MESRHSSIKGAPTREAITTETRGKAFCICLSSRARGFGLFAGRRRARFRNDGGLHAPYPLPEDAHQEPSAVMNNARLHFATRTGPFMADHFDDAVPLSQSIRNDLNLD